MGKVDKAAAVVTPPPSAADAPSPAPNGPESQEPAGPVPDPGWTPLPKAGKLQRGVRDLVFGKASVHTPPLMSRLDSLALGAWSWVSFDDEVEDVPDDDPDIRDHPLRAKTSGWQRRSSSIELSYEQDLRVPAGTLMGTVTAGPLTQYTLECEILTPKQPGDEKKKGFEKSDLPLDPDRVRGLPVGTHVTLHGLGALGAVERAAFGPSVGLGPLAFGATLGPTVMATRGVDLTFELDVRENGKVHVQLGQTPVMNKSAQVDLFVGPSVNRDAMKAPKAAAYPVHRAQDQADAESLERATFAVTVGAASTHQQPDVRSLDLDLNDPKDRETYRSIIALAPDRPMNEERGTKDAHTGSTVVRLGQLDLYHSISTVAHENEEVHALDGRKLKVQQDSYDKNTGGLFHKAGEVSLKVQAFDGAASGGFLELNVDRKKTGAKEYAALQAFAQGAQISLVAEVAPPDATSRKAAPEHEAMDLFITRRGLEALRGTPVQKLLDTCGRESARLDKNRAAAAWTQDALRPRVLSLIARWREATGTARFALADQYAAELRGSGCDTSIVRASEDLETAEHLSAFVRSLDDRAGAWNTKAFRQWAKEVGKHLWVYAATLTTLAGKQEVKVHALTTSGHLGNVAAKDEGSPDDGLDAASDLLDPDSPDD
jgi:hypothetical protein